MHQNQIYAINSAKHPTCWKLFIYSIINKMHVSRVQHFQNFVNWILHIFEYGKKKPKTKRIKKNKKPEDRSDLNHCRITLEKCDYLFSETQREVDRNFNVHSVPVTL